MAHKRMAAELIGTFVLVFGGVGTAVIAGPVVGNVGVAFAFGLSLLAMAYAIGPISGCHINPAVTFGLLVRGKVDLPEAVRYWIAQIVGAIIAAGVLLVIVAGRKGGKAAHERGTAHEFDSSEAHEAGRKGGEASRGSRSRGGGPITQPSSAQHGRAGRQSHKNA